MDYFLPEGIFFSLFDSFTLNVRMFSLPAEVVRRVNALRNLQVEHHKIEASFFEEVHALECRYLSKYQPLYEKVFEQKSIRIQRTNFVYLAFKYCERCL